MRKRLDSSKLAELRSKTDRQLLVLITNQLDAALRSAQHEGDLAAAEESYCRAVRWYPLALSLPHAERTQLERKMTQVRERLYGRLHAVCA
jgi:hypothetical protein